MKKLFFLLSITISFFSCEDDASKKPCDFAKYEITEEIANGMTRYREDCPDDRRETTEYIDTKYCILNALRNAFPDCRITQVPARYRADDEERYCKNNNYENESEQCKVSGYETVIFKVECGKNTRYFDFAAICPPPKGLCDKLDTTFTRLTSTVIPSTLDSTSIHDITYWQIPTSDGEAMERHAGDRGKDQSKVVDANTEIYSLIATRYGKENVKWVNARYRKSDEERYCKKRHLDEVDRAYCGVADYKTQIVKVTVPAKGAVAAAVYYFDAAKICPPPPGTCDPQPFDTTKPKK